jgi:GTP cyclohydrolase I
VIKHKSPTESLSKLKPLLREILLILGEDPDREGLVRTPERWAQALLEYTQGYGMDPKDHLSVTFELAEVDYPKDSDDMVIMDNIEFTSTCEHHMAPFRGLAHIAYIPDPKSRMITGLSKLARVVELFSRRLQLQERMTQQIARAIDEHLNPLGVIVVLQATHYCIVQRGVEQGSSTALTTARRGVFLENHVLETKFQEYLRIRMRTDPV